MLDHNGNHFLVQLANGRQFWQVVNKEDKIIQEYIKEINDKDPESINHDKMPIIKDLQSWNMCPWIPDDRYYDDDNDK